MKFTEARRLAERTIRTNNLGNRWNFEYNKALTTLGQCDYDNHLITLSRYYVFLNDEELIKDVILHEIAHALAPPKDVHSKVWENIFRGIGGSGCIRYPHARHPPEKFLGHCIGSKVWTGCAATFKVHRRFETCSSCKKIFPLMRTRTSLKSKVSWEPNPDWLYFKRICDHGRHKSLRPDTELHRLESACL